MRNTRQASTGPERNDNPILQHVMDTVSALQEMVAASRADQERLLAEVRVEQVLRQD